MKALKVLLLLGLTLFGLFIALVSWLGHVGRDSYLELQEDLRKLAATDTLAATNFAYCLRHNSQGRAPYPTRGGATRDGKNMLTYTTGGKRADVYGSARVSHLMAWCKKHSIWEPPRRPKPKRAGGSVRVAEVQKELDELGYDVGAIDGLMGPRTRAAIEEYQYVHELPVTGKIDDALLAELRSN